MYWLNTIWRWFHNVVNFLGTGRFPLLSWLWGSEHSSIEESKRRVKPPFLFIFVGESGAGKTTAISNIFHAKLPSTGNEEVINNHSDLNNDNQTSDFMVWTYNPPNEDEHQIRIVEVAGFLQNHYTEEDATIITALASFLKKESLDRLPSVIFITAKLTDNRFEGTQSSFSRSVKCLKPARSLLTDFTYSNVVLLLTHADRPEASSISTRTESYKRAFLSAFNASNDPSLSHDNNLVAVSIGTGSTGQNEMLAESLTKMTSGGSNHSLIYKFVQSQLLNNSVNYEYKFTRLPMDTLIPHGSSGRIRSIAGQLMGNSEIPFRLLECDSDEDEDVFSSTCEYPSIEETICVPLNDEIHQNEMQTLCNCVHPKSKIVLASGSIISAEECLVGDRVLGYNSQVGAITKVSRINRKEAITTFSRHDLSNTYSDYKTNQFSHLCMLFRRDTSSKHSEDISHVLLYNEGSQRIIKQKFETDIKEKLLGAIRKSQDVLIIDVDNGFGTFIADNYVRVCQTN